ncbi:three-helix bundle dimerization domain-containing protein [Subtercola frigoramans]|uniref:Uncharacterized protein n=1 Tax=Subtercola frigoramans TaxID=120298 RepID=A0ABS2L144_9MICO|nr:hypothetical protein [Subtercola frigoramans]MBM7470803.1 hypothetical protein [Subtercola frigoramans]
MISPPERESVVTTVAQRIRRYFPAAQPSHITAVVGREFDALNGSRIRGYIPNLVQHNARRSLRAEAEPLHV